MYYSYGSLLTWASIPLWSASLYRGRYLCRIRRACCLKMAVMYTVLSTADTGLLKTLYTKITPSSEVVPVRKENADPVKFIAMPVPTYSVQWRLQQLGLHVCLCLTQQHRLLFLPVAFLKSSDSLLFYQVTVNVRTPGLKNLQEPKRVHKLGTWNQKTHHLSGRILEFLEGWIFIFIFFYSQNTIRFLQIWWNVLSVGIDGAPLVFIWAVRTAWGLRDSRQTMLFTEQLVCLAKSFPSFRASCLRKRSWNMKLQFKHVCGEKLQQSGNLKSVSQNTIKMYWY